MAKDLAISQKKVLFNTEYTGIQTGSTNTYPPIINILQSDKQFKAFGDAEISNKSYGKVFVRTDSNKLEDLKDSLTGTAIKVESGFEVRDSEQKIIESGVGFLDPVRKEEYEADGYKPLNMVKVLMAMGDSKDVLEKVKKYEELSKSRMVSKEDFPFALLVIKGSSWTGWIEAQDQMESLCQQEYGSSSRDSIASLFKFTVRSKKNYSASFGDYYSIDLGVELNDPDEAAAFAPVVVSMKDYSLFYKVGERIEPTKADPLLEFKGM